ncbi:MAG: Uma2 family endonuclease [Pleurocapsa minor HA4230-MV1]|jgi:Uma2 family endonuclease|nr:Uma2 family endonuclease [Pleurocapsa minor HA4230-MV1]
MLANNISTNTQTLPLLLNVSNTVLHVTPEEFDSLCLDNPDLRLELTKDHELIVMSPTGGESGERNSELTFQVAAWNKKQKLGKAFDSSTGYDFTNFDGGKMSPDVSWIEKSRLDGIDISGFIPVVPDFVIELRSQSDRLGILQSKMLEYQRLGVKLGLLINPKDKQVEVYRLDRETEIFDSPTAIDCQPLMAGFNLDLTEIL